MRIRRVLLAVSVLGAFAVLQAAPPEHSRWRLTFSDEFAASPLDKKKWEVAAQPYTHILSSRWPENVELRDGVCRLLTKKEKRGGQDWTTGHMWSRTFRQKYGYFEARYRYGSAPGLNNAFWLMSDNSNLEIDINEGHYPSLVNMNVHERKGKIRLLNDPLKWFTSDDLSNGYHVYGLEWNQDELIWYVDGILRRVRENDRFHTEMKVLFSTAVIRWAGKITDALDGTHMDVDYVRVYQRLGPRTSAPVQEKAVDVLRHYRLAWSDDFNGASLDTSKWRYRTGPRHWSMNVPESISVAKGKLRIALKKERAGGKQYTAGGVVSKQAFRYGYYEARFKVPPGKGWHTSFWLMNHDVPSGGSEPKQEIDICEQDSINPRQYSVNVHKWQGDHQSYGHARIPTPDLRLGFHTWGAEFTPDYVKFFFDGRLVAKTDVSFFRHGDQHIWLTSIASYLGGTDRVDDSSLPAYAEYDWVRYYQKKPGPGTGR